MQLWLTDVAGSFDREIVNVGADKKVDGSWSPDSVRGFHSMTVVSNADPLEFAEGVVNVVDGDADADTWALLAPVTDGVMVDLKCFDPEIHRAITGHPNIVTSIATVASGTVSISPVDNNSLARS